MLIAVILLDHDAVARGAEHDAGLLSDHHLAGVTGGAELHARADDRRIGPEQWHGLALHVRAHQRAVGVIVLQEGDQRGAHAHHLLGRHIHIIDAVYPLLHKLLGEAAGGRALHKAVVVVDRRVGLGDNEAILLVGGEILRLLGDHRLQADRLERQLDDLLGKGTVDLGAGGGNQSAAVGVGNILPQNLAAQQADGDALGGRLVDAAALNGDQIAGAQVPHIAQQQAALLPDGGVLDGVVHLAVRRLQEAHLVNPREGRHRADQTDVGTLGRLHRADPAIVAMVNVAHLEAGAVAGEAAGAEGREAALVGELGQRVGLIHELAKLRAAEELTHGGHNRADVDQAVWRSAVGVLKRHALLDHALEAEQANPELLLDQLANCSNATVAEVVDVVGATVAVIERDQLLDDLEDIAGKQHAHVHTGGVARAVAAQLTLPEVLIQLVASDLGKVVAARVEEQRLEQRARVLERGRVARAQTLVELHQRLFGVVGRVLIERGLGVGVLGDNIDGAQQIQHMLVMAVLVELVIGRPAAIAVVVGLPGQDSAQQDCDRDLTLAINLDAEHIALVGFELEPGAAVRDQLGGVERTTAGRILIVLEVDAGGANQLRDHDALGAVIDKGTVIRHHREIAEENLGLLDLAGGEDA